MAKSKQSYRIIDAAGNHQASVFDLAAGAALMGLYGDGASIRLAKTRRDIIDAEDSDNIVWLEGRPGDGDASESYDAVISHVYDVEAGWRADVEKAASATAQQIRDRMRVEYAALEAASGQPCHDDLDGLHDDDLMEMYNETLQAQMEPYGFKAIISIIAWG